MLPTMVGEVEIEVPKFSAVHIQGKRAYELARQGIDFVPPKKTVVISRFELLDSAQCEKDLAAINNAIADERKFLKDYIDGKDKLFKRLRAKNQ
jgi:tRNA U55 pseudouridine synthase TruB